jgi:hypothetical protein
MFDEDDRIGRHSDLIFSLRRTERAQLAEHFCKRPTEEEWRE